MSVAQLARAPCALIALGGLLLCLASCGGSSKSTTSTTTTTGSGTAATARTTPTTPTTPTTVTSTTTATTATSASVTSAQHYVRTVVHSGTTGRSGAINLANLGTINYRCSQTGGLLSAELAGGIRATETVYVEGEAHRHLRSGTVQPPPAFTLSGVPTRVLAWHIIQSTEPQTLDGIISVNVQPGGTAGCKSVRWRSFVGVISHAQKWTAPRGWL